MGDGQERAESGGSSVNSATLLRELNRIGVETRASKGEGRMSAIASSRAIFRSARAAMGWNTNRVIAQPSAKSPAAPAAICHQAIMGCAP